MEKTNMARFAELMAFLAQNFSATISPVDIENYWRFLRNYTLNDIEQAIINYCRNPQGHPFMPKPGELIGYIEGSSASQAMRAWAKVYKAIKHLGAYSTVIFDDAIIHAVLLDMGGWITLCHCPEKDLPYKTREFEKRYISYLVNNPTEYPAELIGLVDGANASYGFKTSPVLVGNDINAYNVYKNGQAVNKLMQYKFLSQELTLQLEQLTPTETKK